MTELADVNTYDVETYYDALRGQLRRYLGDGSPISEFLRWEGSVSDTPFVPPQEQDRLDRLSLMADTVVLGLSDESEFRREAARAAAQLEIAALRVELRSSSTARTSAARSVGSTESRFDITTSGSRASWSGARTQSA